MRSPVLECGTGGTTILCDMQEIETYSLEQDKEWAADVLRFIRDVGVIDAPLKDYGGYYWYDVQVDLPMHFGIWTAASTVSVSPNKRRISAVGVHCNRCWKTDCGPQSCHLCFPET